VKDKITEHKICKCSLRGKILHRNKGAQVVQTLLPQKRVIADNLASKAFPSEISTSESTQERKEP
jgi:hypothetical protein